MDILSRTDKNAVVGSNWECAKRAVTAYTQRKFPQNFTTLQINSKKSLFLSSPSIFIDSSPAAEVDSSVGNEWMLDHNAIGCVDFFYGSR